MNPSCWLIEQSKLNPVRISYFESTLVAAPSPLRYQWAHRPSFTITVLSFFLRETLVAYLHRERGGEEERGVPFDLEPGRAGAHSYADGISHPLHFNPAGQNVRSVSNAKQRMLLVDADKQIFRALWYWRVSDISSPRQQAYLFCFRPTVDLTNLRLWLNSGFLRNDRSWPVHDNVSGMKDVRNEFTAVIAFKIGQWISNERSHWRQLSLSLTWELRNTYTRFSSLKTGTGMG